jgi:hypothetical protein
MRKFLKIKKFFQKTCKKFPAADAENQKISSRRRRRLAKSFLAAAAEGRKKLKIFSRRRRERRRLTPLYIRRLEISRDFNRFHEASWNIMRLH